MADDFLDPLSDHSVCYPFGTGALALERRGDDWNLTLYCGDGCAHAEAAQDAAIEGTQPGDVPRSCITGLEIPLTPEQRVQVAHVIITALHDRDGSV